MVESLRALLTGAIDYAGLFPPASLALRPAFENYVRYRTDRDAWMLGRFICPVTKLAELMSMLPPASGNQPPIAIAALANEIHQDVTAIDRFVDVARGAAVVDALEVRLAPGVKPPTHLGCNLWIEATIPAHDGWRHAIGSTIDLLRGTAAGFKLRCGGTNAAAFPPVEQIAFALVACRDASVPIKFTAGLHHPIRHFNRSVDAKMQGFINVFAAAMLVHARLIGEREAVASLSEESADAFRFDDAGFVWHGRRVSTDEIAHVRRTAVTSFGSCSFDEPREDLRALGRL